MFFQHLNASLTKTISLGTIFEILFVFLFHHCIKYFKVQLALKRVRAQEKPSCEDLFG